MKMIAIWAGRIEVAVFMHMNGDVQHIRVRFERLLNSIACVLLTKLSNLAQLYSYRDARPLNAQASVNQGSMNTIGWTYQSTIIAFRYSSGNRSRTTCVAMETLSK